MGASEVLRGDEAGCGRQAAPAGRHTAAAVKDRDRAAPCFGLGIVNGPA